MTSKANTRQVGGTHYNRDGQAQHWDVMAELYGYVWFAGCVSKYIVRFGSKDKGVEGLEKAIHYLEKAEECALHPRHGAGFFDVVGTTVPRILDGAQALVDTYGIKSMLLRNALKYALCADSVDNLVAAREDLQEFIKQWRLLNETPTVPHDATFAPPPITGYKVLRGDQVNLINDFKALGGTISNQLDKVIDMYQSEDRADEEAIMVIQRDFNDQVQAVIAADVPPEGETEEQTAERRRQLIVPFEEAAKAKLAEFNKPGEMRMEGAAWLGQAKRYLQQGLMFAIRAVTRPEGF
jgi:hypothetical protein